MREQASVLNGERPLNGAEFAMFDTTTDRTEARKQSLRAQIRIYQVPLEFAVKTVDEVW